ncbi:hypothetical protein, partial [Bacteroides caecimuris]|uniref:hypothetical protein n=1 Tax=Bacteroides caecimuris TaxID=1796613 RepID=UPI002657BE20
KGNAHYYIACGYTRAHAKKRTHEKNRAKGINKRKKIQKKEQNGKNRRTTTEKKIKGRTLFILPPRPSDTPPSRRMGKPCGRSHIELTLS